MLIHINHITKHTNIIHFICSQHHQHINTSTLGNHTNQLQHHIDYDQSTTTSEGIDAYTYHHQSTTLWSILLVKWSEKYLFSWIWTTRKTPISIWTWGYICNTCLYILMYIINIPINTTYIFPLDKSRQFDIQEYIHQ